MHYVTLHHVGELSVIPLFVFLRGPVAGCGGPGVGAIAAANLPFACGFRERGQFEGVGYKAK